ncbi:DNA polymerase III subunit beta [Streptomyces libani]|uniref:DNA polymerase III subunit beta n=1 Tax=Streptomyces nigrescens TaxID=1920 RepID=UPI0037FA018F
MRLTASRDELAEATRWAARQLPAKPTMPVLAGLLLEATGDTLTVSGYNRETAGQAVVDSSTEETGTAIVPGKLFADIVAALPAGIVELDATEHEMRVSLGDREQYNLPLMPDRDYPALPAAPAVNGTVAADEFAAAISDVSGAAMALNDAVGANEALGSIRITADGDTLTIAATDRYRIAVRTIAWTPERDVTGNLLIPTPILSTAAKALASAGKVQLAFNQQGSNVAIQTDQLTLITRTTDTKFPDVQALMPTEDTAIGSLQVDPGELIKALSRASLVTDKSKARNLRLTMRGDHVDISARGDGPTSRTAVDADIDGLEDDFAIAFNATYLASVLAPIDGAARISVYTPLKPALVRPADADADYTAVLMPVRLTHA